MTHHLGYEKHAPEGNNSGNSRNGKSKKTIRSKRGQLQIDVPRDRASEFEPQLIKKGRPGLMASMTRSFPCMRVG
jgi:transposase-like protein